MTQEDLYLVDVTLQNLSGQNHKKNLVLKMRQPETKGGDQEKAETDTVQGSLIKMLDKD